MASSIEWTNKTWNPTTGCTKISKECDFCYAETETFRKMHNPKLPKYKLGFNVVVEHPYTLKEPYKWKQPSAVFVNSMSDLFHKDVSLDYIKKVFAVMNDTPQHTYQILTKRHDILKKYSDKLNWSDNIWMGVSVGNQIATRRIEPLVNCGAKHKFLSVEPLIEEITEINVKGIDWVIVGGESGSNAVRSMKKEWVTKIKNECAKQDVKFFFKQWGKTRNNPNPDDPTINKEHRYHSKGGSELDGKVYWTNPTVKDDTMPTINLFGNDYLIMDEFEDLNTIWELKTHLPLADKDLLENLGNDIKRNGMHDPILYMTTSNGKKLVLDGHTRLRIAISKKLKNIPTKEVKENFNSLDEVKYWLIKHQLERRNLTKAEKIQLALLSKPTIEKLAKENLSKGGKATEMITKIDTASEIAKLASVGRTTVVKYSKIIDKAPQSVIDKVNNGTISINSAHNSLKKTQPLTPPEIQIDPVNHSHREPIGTTTATPPEVQTKPVNLPHSEPTGTIPEIQIEISNRTTNKSNVTTLLSLDDGQQKLLANEIDVIMVLNKDDHLNILEKNEEIRIGAYYLS
jgi:protein gp37